MKNLDPDPSLKSPPLADGLNPARDSDFSIILGGPLFQLLRRAHLSDDALGLMRLRILVISLLAWLPLLVLSAFEGNLWTGGATVPFLQDIEVHTKFLVAIPLLIFAEFVVHRRMRPIPQLFLERQLIPDHALPRFHAAIASAFRLRNSMLAEALLLAFVVGVGILVVWRHYGILDTATWYAVPSPDGSKLRLAGFWYGCVSLPVFQFLLFRWYFRLFIWARFLWQVSRLELRLMPTHPDRLGGLSFLSETAPALSVLAAAHGVMAAGPIAGRIFFLGASLADFKVEIAGLVALTLCVILGPLLVFTTRLLEAKWQGLLEYGTLAGEYVRNFDAKWLRQAPPAQESLVGSADIQSLADLDSSYDIVRTMHVVPITKLAIFGVVTAALLPISPLVLTMIPLDELFKKFTAMLF